MAPTTKNHVLLAALVTVVVAAIGQTPRAAAVGVGVGVGVDVGAGLSFVPMVSGIVPCSIGSSINPALVQGFPSAGVQLVCGSNVVANVTTGSTGAFAISLESSSIASLLGGQCREVVTTPLAACDVSLAGATGTLAAPLQLLGSATGTGGGVVGTIAGTTFPVIDGLVSFITGLFTFA